METNSKPLTKTEIILRAFLFAVLVFLFLVAVKLFGNATEGLIAVSGWNPSDIHNPFLSLSIGIFLTAIMQSSSASTSIAVAMVAAETLTLEQAIPFIMGANIGSSITCNVVALGHVRERKTFSKAYSVGALQDLFNIMTVFVMFPVELKFHVLSSTAQSLVKILPLGHGDAGASWNPLPILVDIPSNAIGYVLNLCCHPVAAAILTILIALCILFFALTHITANMQVLMESRIEEMLNRVLSKNGLLGLVIGALVTMIIQSSGITTSLLVPLVASGVLRLDVVYPILIGANIGTTITAILAAMAYSGAAGVLGMTLALVHMLFNVSGLLLYYPLPFMRFPLVGAKALSQTAEYTRKYVFIWLLTVYLIIPIVGMWLFW